MSTSILKFDSSNPNFQALVKLLDQGLKITDGEDHAFYNLFNKIDEIKNCLVFYEADVPVGCGAYKEFDSYSVEIKRMFVVPENRSKGIAKKFLTELEIWASSLGFTCAILETGKNQVEALQLYPKTGYRVIPNYVQHIGMKKSICFDKALFRA